MTPEVINALAKCDAPFCPLAPLGLRAPAGPYTTGNPQDLYKSGDIHADIMEMAGIHLAS